MFMLEPYAPKNQMESLPLHLWVLHRSEAIINRSHALFHSTILTAMIYYRASSLLYTYPTATPILPWLLVFASELLLSFIWLLRQAFRWRPISRTVFPERLPDEKELPAIDVFICTADPKKEPAVEVMNTVLSAMTLDYPPEKLSIYLSDDGGSSDTLSAIREAWCFAARWWLPFCRMYGIKTGSPEAYFSAPNDDHAHSRTTEFVEEREKIGRKYQLFKERLTRAKENGSNIMITQNRPSVIEVINDNTIDAANTKMPLLVYVSREKRPSHPHHFKAGALNVLLRVSSIISNSPYILVLDCDMYCNDTTSPRQAMCFHLDPKISPSLAFVQFPQKFHNISENDIYDAQLRSVFVLKWYGMDGLRGPILSGTGFYVKREALYGSVMQEDKDLLQLKKSIGPSNELIISMRRGYQSNVHDGKLSSTLLQETQLLACCTYEKHTHWGQQIGFFYNSVVEDYFTGFMLHCKGWTSVYCNPSRPAFLGSATTNLNDLLVQNTRWYSGLFEVFLSRFCPLIYGLSRMSVLESMCYGFCAFQPLYFLALWCLATIPQLCLLNGIPIYPKVSNSSFVIFTFVFLSSLLKPLEEVLFTGGSIQIWWNELRIWMMKSVTAYFYGSLDAILKLFGMREASFLPTNKVADEEQVKRYQMGKFDFQTSTMLLAPMVTLVILNMISLVVGVARSVMVAGGWDEMFGQIFLSFFIIIVNYPIIEGMILRKDKGCIPFSVTLLCVVFSLIFLSVGSILLMW